MASKNNIELGWTYPRRKKHLDDLFNKKSEQTQKEYFQGKYKAFSVHSIPIGLPKYRIDNGRTYAAQAKYLARPENKLMPKDYFSKDHELDSVQKSQHEILKGMVSEKGLATFFKKNEQSESIILSHDGFVVNGNRRLCSWRELYATGKYPNFSHVDVIILPPADPKDIDELEAKLQVHKDIKADYTWTARALMLKNRQISHGYSLEQLADLFEMSKSDVEEMIDMLAYADTYLEDRDIVGDYNKVDKAEFAFKQLHKKRSKIKGEAYKEVYEKIAFCLIDKAEEGRLYQSIPEVADSIDIIIKNIKEEFNIKDEGRSSGLDLLGGGGFSSVKGVIDVLDEEGNREKLRTIALDVIESEKIKLKEKGKRDFVLSQVKKANTALVEAVGALDAQTKKEGISSQISEIEVSLSKLNNWIAGGDRN